MYVKKTLKRAIFLFLFPYKKVNFKSWDILSKFFKEDKSLSDQKKIVKYIGTIIDTFFGPYQYAKLHLSSLDGNNTPKKILKFLYFFLHLKIIEEFYFLTKKIS